MAKKKQNQARSAPAANRGGSATKVATAPATATTSHLPSFLQGHAVRETVESIVVAFILAFLFRSFEAEAFVIPTGSMAPTLMGAHKDLLCPTCGYRYQAGASSEAEDVAQQRGFTGPVSEVTDVTCPLCRTTTNVDPRTEQGRQYPTYGGDRILVSKFTFDFNDPRRWDVTVFKYPGEAQTNYIKRLVGLPGETVRIRHGDLSFRTDQGEAFQFDRRPPDKLLAMAQIVYDNNYVVDEMSAKGWPVRWQPWPVAGDETAANWSTEDGSRSYSIDGSADDTRWLGYRHYVPSAADWELLKREKLPENHQPRPRLVTDFCAYNTSVQRDHWLAPQQALGLHWVGDLMLQCELQITKPDGEVVLELVEGGRRFRCQLDVATGEALLAIDGLEGYAPKAQTAVRGVGTHRVALANFDDDLVLWVDGSPVKFDAPTAYPELDNHRPQSTSADPGDLLPARIGSQRAGVKVSNVRLLRDVYYIATQDGGGVTDYIPPRSALLQMNYDELLNFWSTPSQWAPEGGESPFDQRGEALFPLAADQFFVLGDNSPLSQDARLWYGERYVARDLLVGKALYIFWPHSFDKLPGTNIPFPFFPNFARMGFIR